MRYSKILIAVLLLAAVTNSEAQQLQISSMYDLQGILHNPSVVGANHKDLIGISYRNQWSSISGNPTTATAFGSFDLPKHKIGLGGHIYNDKAGAISRTGITVDFAKHIILKDDAVFSLGIELRGQQYSIDRAKLSQTLGGDPALGTVDNKFKFDAGFGISYTSKKFQIGASVSQLVQSKLGYYSGNGSQSPTEEGRLYRHYYLHGLYNWSVDPVTTITPNFMLIYLPNAPVEFQGGIRVEHNELFWWGLSLRAKQSFMLSAGVNVRKKFRVGYSYDIYKTPSSVYDGGSGAHEILVSYTISK